jgi:hypothetical protein
MSETENYKIGIDVENKPLSSDICNALIKQLEQSEFKPHHIKYIDENGNLVEITK